MYEQILDILRARLPEGAANIQIHLRTKEEGAQLNADYEAAAGLTWEQDGTYWGEWAATDADGNVLLYNDERQVIGHINANTG